jgi:hypothetical protein
MGIETKSSSAGKKSKGPITTPKGTRTKKVMKVGLVRSDGTWSGRRRMVKP